ncbi:MAG: sigma-70 family RNA polymerase sigma factor [Planctomycetota bacterium]|nr:sigma-70 family RNA polymerase sigma factor [Planctomycetota bacterium]
MEAQATGVRAGPSDDDLIAQVVAGEAQAFETLVLRYQDRIFNLLRRQTGSDAEAEDLAQETFLKAYRGIRGFRKGSRFFTWLFRIAVNAGFSRGRQTARRQAREGVSLDAEFGAEGGSVGEAVADAAAESPEAALERKELAERVQRGLEQLKDDYRAILLLRETEGLDYEAIAETLGMTHAAVKSKLHRARLELARVLKDLGPDGPDA